MAYRPSRGIFGALVMCFVLAAIIYIGVAVNSVTEQDHSTDMLQQSVQRDSADQTKATEKIKTDNLEKQQEKEAREQSDADDAAIDAKEDADNAAKWDISIQDAKIGREKQETAYLDCVQSLKERAKYDYKSDWGPNYGWVSDGSAIIVKGRDVHLQDAAGTYAGGYLCKWDISTSKVLYAEPDTD